MIDILSPSPVVLPEEPMTGLGVLRLDGAWGRAAKDYIQRARTMLFEKHRAGATGHAVVEGYTRVVDHVVQTLFAAAQASYRQRYAIVDQRCTLVAQGGYGRGELNPCSDIDLLFLFPYRRDPYVETVTEKILYALWDTGIDVGYATRNVRECVRLAAHDFKVKTSLLDARFIAGDRDLFRDYSVAMENDVLKRNVKGFFRDKLAENEERHRRYGDSVHLVEPHLKEGEGGLRDLHTALWLAKVKFKTNSIAELVRKSIITEREQAEIEAARDFLWRVRNALHFMSGQHQDQLTFEYQERIAADLGFRDDGKTRGVEQFMRQYYLHAATVNWFAGEIISRCLERSSPYRLIGRLGGREVRPGVRIAAGEMVVGDPRTFAADPSMLLRVFADSQQHGVRICDATRRLIREHARRIDDSVRRSTTAIRAFFDILGGRSGVHDTLCEMHKLGVLGAFLPEFGNLLCMAQYDLYHLYTVDEHSLRAVRALERLRLGEYKQSAPLLTDVMREVDRVEILYLAMLLHDIGKGLGGDHSNRGAAMVRTIAERLQLNADEAAQIEFLVRDHLLMSHLATRRDIHDEKLVIDFAERVQTVANLKKLYLLTFADMRAVNPKVWNNWHDMLLGELYVNTMAVFERGVLVDQDRAERAARIRSRVRAAIGARGGAELEKFLAEMPDRYFLSTPEADMPRHFELSRRFAEESLVVHLVHFGEREFSELTVVTRDRPGLFAKITGVLTAHGMNILGARIATSSGGLALDVFRISHSEAAAGARSDTRWERVHSLLGKVLDGEIDVEKLVAEARRPSILGKKIVPRVGTNVEIDNRVSQHYTVLDVYTQDRVGVLFAITNTLYHLDVSIHLAKITTNVDQVLDVFYITDAGGHKIEDAERIERLRSTLHQVLQPPEGEPASLPA